MWITNVYETIYENTPKGVEIANTQAETLSRIGFNTQITETTTTISVKGSKTFEIDEWS